MDHPPTEPPDPFYAEALARFQAGDYLAALPAMLVHAGIGLAEAQCIVGSYLQLGLAGTTDLAEAEHWYLRSAAQGYPVAMNNLGTLCLQRGEESAAKAWYAKAREHGFMHSPE